MRYIVINISYGNGPYLRMTELAIALNNILERNGQERRQIIVPLLYGSRQSRIMEEELGPLMTQHANDVRLDEDLGNLFSPLLYAHETYGTYLERWLQKIDNTEKEIATYLRKTYGTSIDIELNRAPRVLLGTGATSYLVSFASTAEILERAQRTREIPIDTDLLQRCSKKMRAIEESSRIHFLSTPGTFTWDQSRHAFLRNEVATPPTIRPPHPPTGTLEEGIYVTITGIPGLERLYESAQRIGLHIYTNDPLQIPGSKHLSPAFIGHSSIRLHIARAGWSSIWLSLLTETPFVALPFDPDDDPEIFFNNLCIEKLGIGTVYNGQSLDSLLITAAELQKNMDRERKNLLKRFQTLDGLNAVAQWIADDYCLPPPT